MSGNVIYRGPVTDEPETVNLPVAGAYLPGKIVVEDGTNLTEAVAADHEKELLILSNQRYKDQDVATAYTSGDTGVAYRPRAGQVFQARMAAATYAKGDPLTVGATGRLEASVLADVVHAYFEDTGAALSADALADVRWANSFVKA